MPVRIPKYHILPIFKPHDLVRGQGKIGQIVDSFSCIVLIYDFAQVL